MVDPQQRALWAHRGLFVLLAAHSIFARLLPLGAGSGGGLNDTTLMETIARLPGPDVLLCLILAWEQRRPEYLPALLIAAVVLMEDFLLMRPPGLWTALVLIAGEFLRNRAALTRELSFIAEWLLIAAVMTGMFLVYRVMFTVAFLPQPSFGFAMAQVLATILFYPLVVWLSHLALGVDKPAMGEVDAQGRRR